MPALWKKELKYKLITDQHEYQFPPTFLGKLFYLAVRRYVANFSFRKSDAIISITPRGKEFMIKYHHLKPDSILLFPLGADTDKLKFNPKARKKIRKKLKIKDDETLLVCLGQVIRLKKIELLLEAFSKLSKNTMLNTKVLIIGGGEEDYLQELKKRARTLNIREKMLFINRISKKEVPEYYSASDIAVWPFRATIAIQEAISCGVPIVIPNLSSMNHLVENNGFLFRQEDTSDMAEKIETLIKNKKLRKKMSENAKKLAEEKFSYRKISKSLLGLYQELLDREE
jgi:glycosyltransferase involved in cell wall biosynthesis